MAEKDTATLRPACEYLRKQAEKLAGHLEGARTAADMEDVHQVRVASRRMRAALRLFEDCFDPRLADPCRKQLKKLLKRFGPARDLDVQIVYLEEEIKSLDKKQKALRPGMARLLLRRRQERQKAQKPVLKAVERLEGSGVLTSLRQETDRVLSGQDGPAPSLNAALADRIAQQVQVCLADVETQLESLQDAGDIAGHHRLRIAVKKLRYTLEIAETAMEGALKPSLKQLKRMQTLLGQLHDCDVWMAEIEQFREEEKQRTLEYFGHTRPFGSLEAGLDFLRDRHRRQRGRLFKQTVRFAEAMDRDGEWNRIRDFTDRGAK